MREGHLEGTPLVYQGERAQSDAAGWAGPPGRLSFAVNVDKGDFVGR